jgi:hypothetical protein
VESEPSPEDSGSDGKKLELPETPERRNGSHEQEKEHELE